MMRTQYKTRSKSILALVALGSLSVPGCGDAPEEVPAPAPRLEYATNTPREIAREEVAGFGQANHLRPVDNEPTIDGLVRPADFSWQNSGPQLPANPATRLNPADAWRDQSRAAQDYCGRPAESLYPRQPGGDEGKAYDGEDHNRNGEDYNRQVDRSPSQPPPWSIADDDAQSLREPPPREAYGLPAETGADDNTSGRTLADANSRDSSRYPATNPAPELPRSQPGALPWQVSTWETGPRTAYAPKISPAPVLPAAVSRRAEELTQRAFDLAARGATYSAREELIRALEIVAESLDASEQSTEHRQALAAAFRAMDEAVDFSPRGSTLLMEIDIKTVSSGHVTPVLRRQRTSAENISAIECSRAYYTFAQQQLSFACGNQRPASLALYGLGKLNAAMAESGADGTGDPATRSIVFHQAALAVDSGNWRAANELAVQFARSSRYEEARGWLQHATQLSDNSELWANLAKVHGYLGEDRLAREASAQSERLAQRTNGPGAASVQWLPPQAFTGAPPNR